MNVSMRIVLINLICFVHTRSMYYLEALYKLDQHWYVKNHFHSVQHMLFLWLNCLFCCEKGIIATSWSKYWQTLSRNVSGLGTKSPFNTSCFACSLWLNVNTICIQVGRSVQHNACYVGSCKIIFISLMHVITRRYHFHVQY